MYYQERESHRDAMSREHETKHLRKEYKMQSMVSTNPKMEDLAKDW